MKQKFCFTIVALMAISIIVFSFVACNSDTTSTDDNTSEADTVNSLSVFNSNLAYAGVQQENEITFANSINIDGKYCIYYFYLGNVSNVPIYSTDAVLYEKENEKYVFEFKKLKSEELESSISKTKETIDTHSYTGGFSVKIGASISAGAKEAANDAGNSISASASIGTSHSWTNNWGSIATNVKSSTEKYLEEDTSSFTLSGVYSEENGFKKGKYYRRTIFDSVGAYGVLIYDVENNSYSATDDFLLINNSRKIEWEESDDAYFKYPQTKSLTFDLNKAIKYAETHSRPTYSESSSVSTMTVFDNAIRTGHFQLRGNRGYTLDIITLDRQIQEYVDMGYSKLNISLSYDIREVENCKQHVSLSTPTGYDIYSETIEHGGSNIDTEWGTHYITTQVNLSVLDTNQIYFKCQAEDATVKGFEIGTVRVKIVATK